MLAELYFSLLVRLSVRGHSNLVIFNRVFSKFHIWMASIEFSFKFKYKLCLTKDNHDGHCLSVICCRGHSNLVVFNQISS